MKIYKKVALLALGLLMLAGTARSAVPSDYSGLQLWLDSSQSNSFYKDSGKSQAATSESDKIAVWADKSGNVNDAVQPSATLQPTLTLNKDGGYSGVQFGTNANVRLNFGNPSSMSFSGATTQTIFIVAKKTGTSDNNMLHKGTSFNSGYPELFNYSGGYFGVLGDSNGIPGLLRANNSNLFVYCQYLIGHRPTVFYTNGATIRTYDGPNLSNNSNTWNLGGDTAYAFNGYMQACLIYNRALTPIEIYNVEAYLATQFSIPNIINSSQIFYDGNSITRGDSTGNPLNPYPRMVYGLQGSSPIPYVNHGISGIGTSTMTTYGPTDVDPYYNSDLTHNILVGYEGTNDNTYSDLPIYYAARKAAGWTVAAVTVLPHNSHEDDRQTINTNLRANYTNYADALVDLGADPTIGQAGQELNTTYYAADHIHPIVAGQTIIATRMHSAISALLDPLTSPTQVTAAVAQTTATITWTTNVAASSLVDYGATTSYGTTTSEIDSTTATRKTSHSVTLTSLTAGQTYHYQVRSSQRNSATDLVYLKYGTQRSVDGTFTTTGAEPTPTPGGTATRAFVILQP